MAELYRGIPKEVQTPGRMHVEFYPDPFTGEDMLKIRYPGDKLREPHFIANEVYQQRFPEEWAAYQKQADQLAGQTRVEDVPWIDPGLIGALKANHVLTVEQLASVDDSHLAALGFMDARGLREKAVAYVVEKQKAAKHDDLQSQIDTLTELLAEAENKTGKPAPKAGR